MRLFICTEREDEALLHLLTDALDGYRMTFDIDRLIGNRDAKPALQAAIQDCDAFVFALSPSTIHSRRCGWEFAEAEAHERPIIIAQVAPVDKLPTALEPYLLADMTAPEGPAQLLDALFVAGATPPSILASLFRHRLALAVVVSLGIAFAVWLAGPQSPYREDVTEAIISAVDVADRADNIYFPPDPTADPTLVAAQEPLQQATLAADAEDVLRGGQELARNGDYAGAIAAFNRVLGVTPGSVGAHIARADVYLAIDEPDTAWGDYTRAIELAPALALPYARRAAFFVAVNDPASALADTDRALNIEPDNIEALVTAGRAHTLTGNYAAAITTLDRAVSLAPSNAIVFEARAHAHAANGADKLARTDYDTALSYNPTYAAAYIGRASLSLADGNTDAALADYEQAVNFAPDNAEARVVRGALLADRGDYAVATTDYTRALTANPDDAALYIARALAYRCDVQPALAVADLTRAADIDLDTVALTLTNRATYDCTGMEAPPFDPDRVGVTDPDLTGAYTYVARALAARADERLISGDDVGVVNDLTRAAQLTPSYTEAATWLHQRGVLYEGQGNLNAALADYEIAVDITPERADYHADLGRIYARLGDTDAARLSLTRAIERDPSLMGAYITRADVFLRDDFPQAALYDFAAAVDLDPVYVPALAGRVRALVALGACTDAGAALPGVEAISPDAPEVEAARLAYNGACLAVNEG